jgi:hypothetical protein
MASFTASEEILKSKEAKGNNPIRNKQFNYQAAEKLPLDRFTAGLNLRQV